MFSYVSGFRLVVFVLCITVLQKTVDAAFRDLKNQHVPSKLSESQIDTLTSLTDTDQLNNALDKICIPRGLETPGHRKVKEYLKNTMTHLGWAVETDEFPVQTVFGTFDVETVIAKLKPNAKRYLTLACNYDTVFNMDRKIYGATASAVPCAQLLNLASVMQKQLKTANSSDISLMFIFFDGNEPVNIGIVDRPMYGYFHLANRWAQMRENYENEIITELDKMNAMVYLKYLGTLDTVIRYRTSDTQWWHAMFAKIERTLATLGKLDTYYFLRSQKLRYFSENPTELAERHSFGNVVKVYDMAFHESKAAYNRDLDQRKVVDITTTENLNKILRVFVASYLKLQV